MKTNNYSFRRILALLLSFTLLISSLELTAFAEGITSEPADAYADEEILSSEPADAYAGEEILSSEPSDAYAGEEMMSSDAEASSQEADPIPDQEFTDGDQGIGEEGDSEEAADDELSEPALMSESISTWEQLQYAINHADDGAEIMLTQSITAPDESSVLTFLMGTDVTLDLQGFMIQKNLTNPASDGYVINVGNGNVTIKGAGGCIKGGNCLGNGGGVYVSQNASLTLEEGAFIDGNSAERGGGIYVAAGAALIINGGGVQNNAAGLYGGGIYVESGGSFTFSGGDIKGNEAEGAGGGIYVEDDGSLTISGGSITGNAADHGYGSGSGIYLNSGTYVTLDAGGVITIAENGGTGSDNVYLPSGKYFNVNDAPAEGSSIHVYLQDEPGPDVAVPIAASRTDCVSCFIVDNQPANTEIEWNSVDCMVVLKRTAAVLTWEELQNALEDGGTWEFAEPENIHIIRLGDDVTARVEDTALLFQYTQHPVILDLCGHTINRNLDSETKDGNVLTVTGGELILRDSVGNGEITGGYNKDDSGSGLILNGGTFTMESGSITDNKIEDVNGAGVYLNDGTFNLKGGSITGNTAIACLGGGIYMNGGTFNVSGSPVVTGNFSTYGGNNPGDMDSSNIYLYNGNVITLTGELTEGASLYVGASRAGTITSGYNIFHSEEDPDIWFTADDEDHNLYCGRDGEIALENGHDDEEVWTWSEDHSSAVLEMSCKNCGRVLWTEQDDEVSGPVYDTESNSFVFTAEATHEQVTYSDVAKVQLTDDMYVQSVEPYVDEEGSYVFGTREHFELTLGDRTYYFETTEDSCPGQVITGDPDFAVSYFTVSGQTLEKYVGPFQTGTEDETGTGTGTTSIELPGYWPQAQSDTEEPVKLNTLGSGTSGFFTDIETGEMTIPAGAGVQITDRGSITTVKSVAFAGCSNVTLTLSAADAITIEGGAFTGCSDVTLNLPKAVPVTLGDGAFTDCSGVTIVTTHDSGLAQGEHDDAFGKYTVVVEDGHAYTPSADWAEDYSGAEITLTCTCGDTKVIGSEAVTVTRTENEDHTFTFTASGEYGDEGSGEAVPCTVTLENVPSFCVTVSGDSQSAEESVYVPKAQDSDYAVFTVTQEMMEGLTVPPGAVLGGVTNGSQTYNAGATVYITEDTAFDAVWTSTWKAVRDALRGAHQEDPEEDPQEDPQEGQQTDQVTVYLYNDIQAGEDDLPLIVPSGTTAYLILRGCDVDRNLSAAVDDGYAIRVDGALHINEDPMQPDEPFTGGIVTGGKNTGSGGGIYVSASGTLQAVNTAINSNTSGSNGGGIYMEDGGRVDLTGCTVMYNRAAERGGGILVGGTKPQAIDDNNDPQGGRSNSSSGDTSYSLTLESTAIENNYAMYGGGICVLGAVGLGGYVLFKNKTSVIDNRNLDGTEFNNLDVGEQVPDPSSVFKVAEGVTELTVGVPAAAAAGGAAASLPVWAKALIAAGVTAVGTAVIAIIIDSNCNGENDTQKKSAECNHPTWKTITTEWEEEHYNYVREYRECTVCHKGDRGELTPSRSVDDTTQVTKYLVTLSDGTTEERDVDPYKVILTPGIDGMDQIQNLNSILQTYTYLIPHGRNEGESYSLPGGYPLPPELPNQNIEYYGYKFIGWILGSDTITQVDFDPGDGGDDQTKTIVGKWQVSITYDPGTSQYIGSAPIDPNPTWVDIGTPHDLRNNNWEGYFEGVDKEGNTFRSLYRFDGWDVSVGVRFTDRFTPEYIYETATGSSGKWPGENTGPVMFPIKIRARWKSPWKMLGEKLEEFGSWKLSENVYATQKDTSITVKVGTGAEKELDLNGFKAYAWLLSLTENPFNVEGRFRVKDTSADKNGCISGGHSVTGVGGVMVKKNAAFTLESGNIRDNDNIPTYLDKKYAPDGGGVYVEDSGTFIMEGGGIRNNTAAGSGGGVYVKEDGTFTMTGGEITGNKARFRITDAPDDDEHNQNLGSCLGGGVYVGGAFKVSGKINIQDNEVSETVGAEKTTASNVYLPEGKKIEVIGSLDGDSRIGVSMAEPGVITSGLNADGGDDARGSADNFVSDDPYLMVIINGDGEAELVKKCVITFEKGDENAKDTDDGGNALMPADEAECGSEYELPDCRFGAPEGKIFKEWSVRIGDADPVNRQPHTTITVTADTTATAVWTDEPVFRKQSLLLTGLIGVNIFMELPGGPEQYADSYMTFTVNDKEETASFNSDFKDREGYYGFTGHINAIQMAEPVTCTFHYGGGETVSTTVKASDYIERCMTEYVDYPKVKALLEALGNYGHYVQPYLSSIRGWTIGTDYQEMPVIPGDYVITSDRITSVKTAAADFALSTTIDSASKTRLSYSLNLESGTLIYLYIKPEEGKTVTAELDGNAADARQLDGGYYVVTVPGISAQNLGGQHTIDVTVANGNADGDTGTENFNVKLSALSYVNTILNPASGSFSQYAQEAVTALFDYYEAAKAYLDQP